MSSSASSPLTPPTPETEAGSPEERIRTLLEVLETMSGLGGVYVTRFHPRACTLEVLFAQPSLQEALLVPEGLEVPWYDTLCRRAMQDDVQFTEHADDLWDDVGVVRELGLCTFLGEPIRNAAGELIGHLCGISVHRVPVGDSTRSVFRAFARLIAHHLEKPEPLATLPPDHETPRAFATRDPLTGVANRQGLREELHRALAQAEGTGGRVVVVFIHLDRFPSIVELYGRRVGDRLLVCMAGRLVAGARSAERVARLGPDEFVVVTSLGPGNEPDAAANDEDEAGPARRFLELTQGRFQLGDAVIDYPGASVKTALCTANDDVESLMHRASRSMGEARQVLAQRQFQDLAAHS